MTTDPERHRGPSPSETTLLLNGIPRYESVRGDVEPVEVSRVAYVFGRLIKTYTPIPFDRAGGKLSRDDLAAIGAAAPDFTGSISLLVSNVVGLSEKQQIDVTHFSSVTGYWTEGFEYYIDELGEVHRKDFRAEFSEYDIDEESGDGMTWEDRDRNVQVGKDFGINDALVGLDEIVALQTILAAIQMRRFNTQTGS